MPATALAPLLIDANKRGSAIAGLVVLGWEDAVAFVAAAEDLGLPVILQAGPGCRAHCPTPVLGKMFRSLADQASVPVCCHVDHASTIDECQAGIDSGFTSVMIDGSALSLNENIALTRAVVEAAKPASVSVEGEVGFVGYAGQERGSIASQLTKPADAARFAAETEVDALAVSVGNVHLQTEPTDGIDYEAVAAIQQATSVPLVIHGGSGVPTADRARLARKTTVAKFNIGTELRQTFGASLRAALAADPTGFDRIKILSAIHDPMKQAAAQAILSCTGDYLPGNEDK